MGMVVQNRRPPPRHVHRPDEIGGDSFEAIEVEDQLFQDVAIPGLGAEGARRDRAVTLGQVPQQGIQFLSTVGGLPGRLKG